MTTKWTPGPWFHHGDGRIWQKHVVGNYGATHKTHIADCSSLANAKLVEAAPDMAESLRECIHVLTWEVPALFAQLNKPVVDKARALLQRIEE